ncbi:copper-binding protein [Polaromonas sp. SM01]|uniref:copper-binding protein n=1 Tax=Polaromonas sp. SM01 TaxID=3085630 RepID=UPI00298286EA|nr:copper-binding protein [Polaromonas sp. SM01]MDW5443504.1 copper-binding protein [Polaromonas sp. SM01]
MTSRHTLVLLAALLAGAAHAQTHSHDHTPASEPGQEAAQPAAELSEGEVRKVDKDAKKISIKHGELKNLDMPPMSMVFQVKDPALLDKVKAGDKIRFRAEKAGPAFVVTDIQLAN